MAAAGKARFHTWSMLTPPAAPSRPTTGSPHRSGRADANCAGSGDPIIARTSPCGADSSSTATPCHRDRIDRPRAPLRHPPGRLQPGNQHQQRRALIDQQRQPQRLRSKQPDKKRQYPPCPGHSAEANRPTSQASALHGRLLKARQSGHLRAIHLQIDLHITPNSLARCTYRYDITKSVKYSYTITCIQRCPTCRLPEALTEMPETHILRS
jgi:hypothetical protein